MLVYQYQYQQYAQHLQVADYLRETEDILSYEPFLGVADPPQDVAGGARGGVTSRLEDKQCVLLREAHTSTIRQNFFL